MWHGMVLCDEIKQHSSFLLDTGIKLFASKRLIDLANTALEGIILLIAK